MDLYESFLHFAEDSLDFWLAAVLVHAPDARLIIVGSHDARLFHLWNQLR